jgi:murein DD-endopeptidase MepM/ murein hydrolase activator NlpD
MGGVSLLLSEDPEAAVERLAVLEVVTLRQRDQLEGARAVIVGHEASVQEVRPVGQPHSFIDPWGASRSGGRAHQGVDMMAPHGTPTYAYTDGVVSRTDAGGGLGGTTLYLRGDDGNEYYYAHLSQLLSSEGQRVAAGRVVGRVGATGNASASAPHLHFEVHRGGGYAVNPYPYAKRACG